ncbi:MAG TPA: hypothetical protein VHG51_20790, partial [Longimicrobiaceae bacterium]|nr:hypothetical protein [Longimicrobiaceae bacterium]
MSRASSAREMGWRSRTRFSTILRLISRCVVPVARWNFFVLILRIAAEIPRSQRQRGTFAGQRQRPRREVPAGALSAACCGLGPHPARLRLATLSHVWEGMGFGASRSGAGRVS